ncbi:MAG: hypothetical protein CSA81_14845 [Acidobacteria bacterium]|nr:MAG: hypothetical protein CSA81_14845 [Acidobacteriota bacterium]
MASRDDRQSLVDAFEALQLSVRRQKLIPIIQKLKIIDPTHRPRYRDALMQSAVTDGEHHITDALIRYEKYRSRNVHAENSLVQLAIDLANH